MDSNFINAVRNNFENLVIAANASSIKRAEFGFVNSDCDMIKSMIGCICNHALYNPDIFNDKQSNNIMILVNNLTYG